MVVIQLKKGEQNLFLWETPAKTQIKDLIVSLLSIHNFRLRLQRLITSTKDLLEFGPMKPENEQGYTDDQLEELSSSTAVVLDRKPFERDGFTFYMITDPTGRRIGEACGEDGCSIINKALTDAEALVSNESVHFMYLK
jgi:hypothetical protein